MTKITGQAISNQAMHSDQKWYVFPTVYFFLSLTNLILKLRTTPAWTSGKLVSNHKALMAFQYFNNEQDRVLQFLVPEFIHRLLGISIESSYALARLAFVFLAFVVFHLYLRKWFSPAESFAGVLILSGSLAVSFLQSDLQESSPLLMLLYILGLWAIREEKDLWFACLLLIGGGLTNETMLVMPLAYFLYRLPSKKWADLLKTGLKTLLLALPAFLVQGFIRYINRGLPHLGGAYHLPGNLSGIWNELTHPTFTLYEGTYLYPFLIFTVFWFLAAFGYPKSPRFLRCAFWIVPFYLAAHLITGVITESRQMIPLAFILIPMALFYLFPKMETGIPTSPALDSSRPG